MIGIYPQGNDRVYAVQVLCTIDGISDASGWIPVRDANDRPATIPFSSAFSKAISEMCKVDADDDHQHEYFLARLMDGEVDHRTGLVHLRPHLNGRTIDMSWDPDMEMVKGRLGYPYRRTIDALTWATRELVEMDIRGCEPQ